MKLFIENKILFILEMRRNVFSKGDVYKTIKVRLVVINCYST